jgi:hypothetical protein
MNTLVLNSETAKLSLEHLLQQLGNGGVEVRDAQGNMVAIVLGPIDKEALTYAEANLYLDQHKDQMLQALRRRGGVTTSQLLEKAALAAEEAARK